MTRPAAYGAHTRKQFLYGKRFDEIIVCARIKSLDTLADIAERRHEQNGRCMSLRAQPFEKLYAIRGRQHSVQQDQIVRLLARPAKSIIAVMAYIGDIPFHFQRETHCFAQLFIVLNNQNPHGGSSLLLVVPAVSSRLTCD